MGAGALDDFGVDSTGEGFTAFGERLFFASDRSGKFGMAENNKVDDKIDDAKDEVTGCSDDVDDDVETGTRDKGIGEQEPSSDLSFDSTFRLSVW